jgi:serine/threonine protein kinase
VVKVLDVGEHAALPYVVMQLLSGGSLTDRLQNESDEQGRMSPESLKSWVRETGRALDFCFRKGMVHRDVKPANILFDEDNNPYVADFGLSKVMYGEHEDLNSSETAAGIVLGTPNYISPEIVLGQPYDGRADQYSLGITIYHVLTGKAPMQGNSATATMVNQTQRTLDLLSDVRPDMISRPLANAIPKSIEKDPNKRFASCEEFGDAILDGLRVPVSRTAIAASSSSASAVCPTPAKPAKPTAAKTRAQGSISVGARKSSQSSTSGAAQSGSGNSQKLAGDMEWFDVSDESSEAMPLSKSSASLSPRRARSSAPAAAPNSLPHKKGASKRKSRPSKKANALVLFGKEVHPAAAAGIGVALATVFLWIVVMRFTGEAASCGV